jgi:hypothetical protein
VATTHQTKIAHITWHLEATYSAHEAIEQKGGSSLHPGLAIALPALGVNHVEALSPTLHQIPYKLRRILQISIDYYNRVTAGVIKPGRHRGLFSKVPREVKDTDMGISPAELLKDRESAIAAAIIDVDGFPLGTEPFHHAGQAAVKLRYPRLFVEGRNDY